MQTSRLDQFVGRILFVKPQPIPVAVETDESEAQRAFKFSLIFTGVRCILQYIVLPFILPVIGIAAASALPLLLLINVFAIVSMLFSVRRFWQINYQYKWQYLLMALLILAALTGFIALDLSRIRA
ncbi:MAG: hypothetical protein ABI700_09225 [Chloroflexota bacterium]